MSKFPKTNISVEKKARSVEEAIEAALTELGISRAEAVIEIVQEPSKGFLGLGAKEAIVRVSSNSDAEETAEGIVRPVDEITEEETAESEVVEAVRHNSIYDSELPEENAKNFISDILTAMGLDVKVTAYREDDMVKVNLDGENMGIVIGKRGDTLDSLQYLTSLVINQSSKEYMKISIDTENYREKRSEALNALSERLAAKVARTGKKFTLEPMNPYERRIIHSNLQDNEYVTTFSVGQEPYRKVVISPKNPKPFGGKKSGYKNRKRTQGGRGGYSRQSYNKPEKKSSAAQTSTATYKADFKPQQHKAEYKNFEEYLAAHTKD